MPMPLPTLPADFPAGYSLSRKRMADTCRHLCAGGNACVSTTKYVHFYHCCNKPDCECKTALRNSGSGVSR